MEDKLNIGNILEYYLRNEDTLKLAEFLSNDKNPNLFLKGLSGSSISFVASVCINKLNRPFLFILGDKEEAAYFYNDIANIITPEKAFFFPSSYKRSVQYGQTLAEAVIQRTDVLNLLPRLHHNPNQPIAIVTYPDALFEKVTTIENLEKNTLIIKRNEKISPSFIL